jgi:hypothetical protein
VRSQVHWTTEQHLDCVTTVLSSSCQDTRMNILCVLHNSPWLLANSQSSTVFMSNNFAVHKRQLTKNCSVTWWLGTYACCWWLVRRVGRRPAGLPELRRVEGKRRTSKDRETKKDKIKQQTRQIRVKWNKKRDKEGWNQSGNERQRWNQTRNERRRRKKNDQRF